MAGGEIKDKLDTGGEDKQEVKEDEKGVEEEKEYEEGEEVEESVVKKGRNQENLDRGEADSYIPQMEKEVGNIFNIHYTLKCLLFYLS